MAAFNLMEAGKLPKPLGRVGRRWVFRASAAMTTTGAPQALTTSNLRY